jgi:hypothetical protein
MEKKMANKTSIVIDNYYPNPMEIREHALSLTYTTKESPTYPGKEAISSQYDWEKIRSDLRQHIDEDVDMPCPKNPVFPQGKFRVAVAADEKSRLDLVHEDVQRWSAIIYLSLDQHCKGGVAFYRHKKTRALCSSPQWFAEVFPNIKNLPPEERIAVLRKEFKDPNNWEIIGQIPMLFNRAALVMGQCFHGSTGVFGDSSTTGRLTQHFEYYSAHD